MAKSKLDYCNQDAQDLSQLQDLRVNVMHKLMNVAQNDFPESATKYEVDVFAEISQLT